MGMAAGSFEQWAERYRAAAAADGYRIARAALAGQPVRDLAAAARLLVEATITCVRMALGFAGVGEGEQRAGAFLERQSYDPTLSAARYLVTLEAGAHPVGRLLVDGLEELDLVELYQQLGFQALAIRRTRGEPLQPAECEQLEAAVRADLFFDYDEEQLELCVEHDAEVLRLRIVERPWTAMSAGGQGVDEQAEALAEAWLRRHAPPPADEDGAAACGEHGS
ncbi:MAG: hypothetical protein KatS3mg102_0738 [Planctomycetota bacterium]|nr:MAG: hypothetical protein KatS3mg102_0738 [Planctomycetota bacterium]